jgi:hypothetical protein
MRGAIGRMSPTYRAVGARHPERGAALIEFAVLLPLLLMLLFGIVEFGWGVAQQIDLRHKTREGLRVLQVDGTLAELRDRVCSDDVVLASSINSIVRGGGTNPNDPVTLTIDADLVQVTGLFGWAWGGATTITSSVEGRIEQPTTNVTNGTYSCP